MDHLASEMAQKKALLQDVRPFSGEHVLGPSVPDLAPLCEDDVMSVAASDINFRLDPVELDSQATTAGKNDGAKASGREEGLTKEIRDEISSLRETTKADIKTVHDKLMGKVESLFSMQKEAAVTQSDMKQSLSDTSDRLTALENSYQTLAADQKKLEEKCIDLENRSRRQNIRILNIPEGAENNMPTIFIAKFLSKVLEVSLQNHVLASDPRPMIARLHYYSDKEKIMSLSRTKGKLFFEGAQVHIFPDMSPEVGRQRAAFKQVKTKLRDTGVKYRMLFPAKLEITVDDSRMTFIDPCAVERFINRNKSSSLEEH
uniref:L1 transposable element RRM domain-containing protein n=1 Tax=Knipowitschia caucasica TaxID=637954 RepID=A0AAV2LHK2_KNICA